MFTGGGAGVTKILTAIGADGASKVLAMACCGTLISVAATGLEATSGYLSAT